MIDEDEVMPTSRAWRRRRIHQIVRETFAELKYIVNSRTGLTLREKQLLKDCLQLRCNEELEKVERYEGVYLHY